MMCDDTICHSPHSVTPVEGDICFQFWCLPGRKSSDFKCRMSQNKNMHGWHASVLRLHIYIYAYRATLSLKSWALSIHNHLLTSPSQPVWLTWRNIFNNNLSTRRCSSEWREREFPLKYLNIISVHPPNYYCRWRPRAPCGWLQSGWIWVQTLHCMLLQGFVQLTQTKDIVVEFPYKDKIVKNECKIMPTTTRRLPWPTSSSSCVCTCTSNQCPILRVNCASIKLELNTLDDFNVRCSHFPFCSYTSCHVTKNRGSLYGRRVHCNVTKTKSMKWKDLNGKWKLVNSKSETECNQCNKSNKLLYLTSYHSNSKNLYQSTRAPQGQ